MNGIFNLKSTFLTVLIIELINTDLSKFKEQLIYTISKAPKYFGNNLPIPIIIALDKLPQHQEIINFSDIITICKDFGLSTIAIRSNNKDNIALANMLNILVFPPETKKKNNKNSHIDNTVPRPWSTPSKFIYSKVRSGTQIYASNTDLIVLASVSPGAELIADGNIHVYGTLSGRAIAGVKGNTSAKIFCTTFFAELISIVGNYKIADELQTIPEWGKSVYINLSDNKLHINCI